MRKFKKLLSLALSASMIFCMTACSGSNEEETTKAAGTEPQSSTEATTEATTEAPQSDVDLTKVLVLALNVMYNDADSAYYGNEVGPSIEVTGDGQYTVTFDCASNLSDAAKTAGVRGLNHLTSIYIKDYSVTNGALGASNLTACNIKYDKIVVDGVEFTITNAEEKSAIKSSGIFDTNDPFNAWDGSAVAEVEIDSENHVLEITGVENPQKVEVTFTLSGLTFK